MGVRGKRPAAAQARHGTKSHYPQKAPVGTAPAIQSARREGGKGSQSAEANHADRVGEKDRHALL
jgi:hypothetical protein